ncbi:MAG: tRNA epoxyqueuosine(34) reductase QueG [Pseudomonadota bacterium]
MRDSITFETLRELAASVGLAVVGLVDTDDLAIDRERLRSWQESGLAAEMEFMRRSPDLLSSPTAIMPEARSVVVFGAFYDRGERLPLPVEYGRVARYAWGRDYHKVLRTRLRHLVELVRGELKRDFTWRVFSDSVPLLERALARKAALGFIGKNTMLIVPRAGSFLFLGEVLWDLVITDLPDLALGERAGEKQSANCGTCSRCMDRCPTQAFVSERVLDASRCISYLTIEKRGELNEAEREWLGEWVFGCDVCQDVCPFNAAPIKLKLPPDLEEFNPQRGVGQGINLAEVLEIRSDNDFVKRFGGTPIMRTKRAGLLRNAAIVAANKNATVLIPALSRAAIEDSSALVRQHAVWALSKLSVIEGNKALAALSPVLDRLSKDEDPQVRQEVSDRVAKILSR